MPKIVNIPRPASQSSEYRFLKNTDTNNNFKVKHELRTNPRAEPMLAVSVSQVDTDGKAIVDANGEPLIYWHTHAFTPVELTDLDFNAETRLAIILDTAIAEKERELTARKNLDALSAKWNTATPLKLS
jgi:hypothetical protein